ncbi:MAG: tRNA pseudouridine(38-40) synthase TruA, partial [Chloroflexota bacterium]
EKLGEPEPRRLALVVEYDGSRYAGFQLQSGQPTVQGELERGLERFTLATTRVRGASRTDSGAHARGQVVDFLTHSRQPVERFPAALNYYLPPDIKVQAAYRVDPEFNCRWDAISRTYRYSILNRPWPSPLRQHTHLWVKEILNVSGMATAAQSLVGTHNFRPLAVGYPEEKSATRTVLRWNVWREDDTVVIECEANGFLRHQIRRANALLIGVGKGKYPESVTREVLEGEQGELNARRSVPAYGLCLMTVKYPDRCLNVKAAVVAPASRRGEPAWGCT